MNRTYRFFSELALLIIYGSILALGLTLALQLAPYDQVFGACALLVIACIVLASSIWWLEKHRQVQLDSQQHPGKTSLLQVRWFE